MNTTRVCAHARWKAPLSERVQVLLERVLRRNANPPEPKTDSSNVRRPSGCTSGICLIAEVPRRRFRPGKERLRSRQEGESEPNGNHGRKQGPAYRKRGVLGLNGVRLRGSPGSPCTCGGPLRIRAERSHDGRVSPREARWWRAPTHTKPQVQETPPKTTLQSRKLVPNLAGELVSLSSHGNNSVTTHG